MTPNLIFNSAGELIHRSSLALSDRAGGGCCECGCWKILEYCGGDDPGDDDEIAVKCSEAELLEGFVPGAVYKWSNDACYDWNGITDYEGQTEVVATELTLQVDCDCDTDVAISTACDTSCPVGAHAVTMNITGLALVGAGSPSPVEGCELDGDFTIELRSCILGDQWLWLAGDTWSFTGDDNCDACGGPGLGLFLSTTLGNEIICHVIDGQAYWIASLALVCGSGFAVFIQCWAALKYDHHDNPDQAAGWTRWNNADPSPLCPVSQVNVWHVESWGELEVVET